MRKRKEYIRFTFKKGTTGYEILQVLKEAGGSYPEEELKKLLSDKQPETVRKVIRRLERAGYVLRKKGVRREIIVVLSTQGQKVLNVEMVIGNTAQKITRQGNAAVVNMMFKQSVPLGVQEEILEYTYYLSKKEIMDQEPGSQKVLITSRLMGVYVHYGEYIPVFKFGSSMYWVNHVEQQIKEYLEHRIFDAPVTKAIFLIEDYDHVAMQFMVPPENKRRYGESLRETLELSTCYEKIFMFACDKIGIEQLRFFRSYAAIEELFLRSVFEDSERYVEKGSVLDGYINEIGSVVLFNGDIIQIKRLCRILNSNMLEKLNIICYDFQENFLRTAFAAWSENVFFNSYSLEEVMDVIDSAEDMTEYDGI